jgi:hypothetical protein
MSVSEVGWEVGEGVGEVRLQLSFDHSALWLIGVVVSRPMARRSRHDL